MEMNRGRIGTSSSKGHIHTLDALADVNPTGPSEGDVLVFHNGLWTPMSLPALAQVLKPHL